MTFSWRRLCARAKDFLASLGIETVIDYNQRLLVELGLVAWERRDLKTVNCSSWPLFTNALVVTWQETSYLKDVPVTHIPRLRCPFQYFILFSLGPGLLLLAAVGWKLSRSGL
jgi:hypothetical protein